MESSWSLSGDTLDPVRLGSKGCGAQTASLISGGALVWGGSPIDDVEEYNGSVWSIEANMPSDRTYHGMFGTNIAAAVVGGHDGSNYLKTTIEYNGTTWASGGDISTEKSIDAAEGVLTAALVAGGYTGAVRVKFTEEYNGTAWTSGGDLSETRSGPGACGSLTAALIFGRWGGDAATISTEGYNGTIWAAEGDMTLGRGLLIGFGTAGDAVAAGGNDFAQNVATTEEYNGDAWATKGDMIAARSEHSGSGASTSGLAAGGRNVSSVVIGSTEEFTLMVLGRHRGIAGIDGGVLFNGKTVIGDRSNGKIYLLDMDSYTNNGIAIQRIRRTQVINKQRVNVLHHQIEVEFEPGVGLDVAEGEAGEDPQALLKWSDDGCNTWSAERSVDIGEYGEFGTRSIWRQLGRSRNRVYQLTINDPVKVVLIGVDARLQACKV